MSVGYHVYLLLYSVGRKLTNCIQIVQNNLDRRDAIFESSEYLAETLAYYALIDANYRNLHVGTDKNLDQALLRVYSAILEFTAEVKKGVDESAAGKQRLILFINSGLRKVKKSKERRY